MNPSDSDEEKKDLGRRKPEPVELMTKENEYTLYVNGRVPVRSTDSRPLTRLPITEILKWAGNYDSKHHTVEIGNYKGERRSAASVLKEQTADKD